MVNITKQNLTSLQQQILRVLYKKAGITLNQRQIAKQLNVSSVGVLKALPILEKLNYITIIKDKNTKRYSIELNKNNHNIMQFKRIDNLCQIYEYGLVDFLENEYLGATIILFGSYSRGEDLFNSDIDIAIIGRKEKNINLIVFESKFDRKININYYDSFKNIHKNLKENLANGIILSGGFEL
ncbi:MAG: nucleotidyltransferase domain-containing protein [Candidatus Woesearchaeota archaeon]